MLVGFRNMRLNWNQCNIRLKGKGCHLESDFILRSESREEWEPYLVCVADLQDSRTGSPWSSGPAAFVFSSFMSLSLKELNLSDFKLVFIDRPSKSM